MYSNIHKYFDTWINEQLNNKHISSRRGPDHQDAWKYQKPSADCLSVTMPLQVIPGLQTQARGQSERVACLLPE